MITANTDCVYLLRVPGGKPGGGQPGERPEDEAEDKTVDEYEDLILCRQCNLPITRPAERIDKDGSHRHTFANPHGIVYEIGCFRTAIGCGYSGPASDEFTWFKGYDWRIAVCRACLTHLGWLFSSAGSDQFH